MHAAPSPAVPLALRALLLALAATLLIGVGPRFAAAGDAAGSALELEEELAKALEKARDIEDDLVDAVAKVQRSSVSVSNFREVRVRDGSTRVVLGGCGSGALVKYRSKPWILTNVHVVEGASRLEVTTSDGVSHAVTLHDAIEAYDIALLKFSERPSRAILKACVPVKGNVSDGKIREGTWVIATGNPFFLAQDGNPVATLGVISGTDRVLRGRFNYVGAVQHDAEVNPGNSGGPVWSADGKLVGINGMIMSRARFAGANPTNTGASFALPVSQIDSFLQQLTREGDAQSGFLGLETRTVSDDKGKPIGVEIVKIHRRSPCAGGRDPLREGDLIRWLFIGRKKVRILTSSSLDQEISVLAQGTKIRLKYKRGERRERSWRGTL